MLPPLIRNKEAERIRLQFQQLLKFLLMQKKCNSEKKRQINLIAPTPAPETANSKANSFNNMNTDAVQFSQTKNNQRNNGNSNSYNNKDCNWGNNRSNNYRSNQNNQHNNQPNQQKDALKCNKLSEVVPQCWRMQEAHCWWSTLLFKQEIALLS